MYCIQRTSLRFDRYDGLKLMRLKTNMTITGSLHGILIPASGATASLPRNESMLA
jgi:hypothetical protein